MSAGETATGDGERSVAAPRRPPLRRRPMPCPHCDAELELDLAAQPEPRCPVCGGALTPIEVAGFWQRSAAGAIDLGLLALTAGPLAWALNRLFSTASLAPGARGLDRWLTLASADFGAMVGRAGTFLVLAAIYLAIVVLWTGRTFGQRLLALRIVDDRGRPPTPVRACFRAVAQVLGTVPAALGPLWVAFDSERRAVHDHVAGTYVVRSA